MSPILKQFVTTTLLLALFLSTLGLAIDLLNDRMIHNLFGFMNIFMAGLVIFLIQILIKAKQKSESAFMRTFMMLTMVKMMLLLGIILAYIAFNRDTAILFAINFLSLFLIYLIYEVVCIIKIVRLNK